MKLHISIHMAVVMIASTLHGMNYNGIRDPNRPQRKPQRQAPKIDQSSQTSSKNPYINYLYDPYANYLYGYAFIKYQR